MSSSPSSPHVVEDCFGVVRLLSDGSIVRTTTESIVPVPIIDDGTVLWKDILFNPTHNLHLRLYKPTTTAAKLPILFFFHGGGFCLVSRTWPNIHNCCLRLASDLGALVIAPDYRLAPEHRLPAAIEDGVSAVHWLLAQSTAADPDLDDWLAGDNAVDFNRVFISGDSAGATIAHHLAIHFGPSSDVLPSGVKIRGYALVSPFFGGSCRMKSEMGPSMDPLMNVEAFEQFWRLALPVGVGMDDQLANPIGPKGAILLESVQLGPILVVIAGSDILHDREAAYAERLKGWGKEVEVVVVERQMHGFFFMDPWSEPADELVRVLRRFIDEKSQRLD